MTIIKEKYNCKVRKKREKNIHDRIISKIVQDGDYLRHVILL